METALFLTGQYGAGKNTYQETICDFFGIEKSFGMSDILSQNETTKDFVEKGILVPEELVNKALKDFNFGSNCINGFPRTFKQAQFLLDIKDKYKIYVVVLDIDKKIAEQRMLKRLECDECGFTSSEETYFLSSSCPKCKDGYLFKRSNDSSIQTIKNRIASFERDTIPAILEIKDHVDVFYIELPEEGTIDEVKSFIKDELKRKF